MQIEVLFQIAGIGILATIVVQLLKQNGREELATVAAIVGLLLAMVQMLSMLTGILETVRYTFSLY